MAKKQKGRPSFNKATNSILTEDFLRVRAEKNIKAGFSKQKWVIFAETLIREGFEISLYEARRTVSKYLTVKKDGRQYKVRFSNHRPIFEREKNGDCDFFVGKTNLVVTTTDQALVAVRSFFAQEKTA